MYSLASQLGLLVAAWRERAASCSVDWTEQQSQDLLRVAKFSVPSDVMNACWWSVHRHSRELDMTVEERSQYSVGLGVFVFGSAEKVQDLGAGVCQAKNLMEDRLVQVLAESFPIEVPYLVMARIAQFVLGTGGGAELGWVSKNRADQLVESKYLNSLYLTGLDIYNALREIMFRHTGGCSAPTFPTVFSSLNMNLVRSLGLLKSLQQAGRGEKLVEGPRMFHHERKQFIVRLTNCSSLSNLQGRVFVDGDNVFSVSPLNCDENFGLEVTVSSLSTGQVRRFEAVKLEKLSKPLQNFHDYQSLIRLDVTALDQYLAITIEKLNSAASQTTHKKLNSYHNCVILMDWKTGAELTRIEIPHSEEYLAAEKEENFESSSSDGEDLSRTGYSVKLTKSPWSETLFLVHTEVVAPSRCSKVELNCYGQLVRVLSVININSKWTSRQVIKMENVNNLGVFHGLTIFEELTEEHKMLKVLLEADESINFSNVAEFNVGWLDLERLRVVKEERFDNPNRTQYSPSLEVEGKLQILQYRTDCCGQCRTPMCKLYTVDLSSGQVTGADINFPALFEIGDNSGRGSLKLKLVQPGVVSFQQSIRHGETGVGLTRCGIALEDGRYPVNEIYIAEAYSADEVDTDTIVKDNFYIDEAHIVFMKGTQVLAALAVEHEQKSLVDLRIQRIELFLSASEVLKADRKIAEELCIARSEKILKDDINKKIFQEKEARRKAEIERKEQERKERKRKEQERKAKKRNNKEIFKNKQLSAQAAVAGDRQPSHQHQQAQVKVQKQQLHGGGQQRQGQPVIQPARPQHSEQASNGGRDWTSVKERALVDMAKSCKRCSMKIILMFLANILSRFSATVVNWCGSFGFLRLHSNNDLNNVFIHISDVM